MTRFLLGFIAGAAAAMFALPPLTEWIDRQQPNG